MALQNSLTLIPLLYDIPTKKWLILSTAVTHYFVVHGIGSSGANGATHVQRWPHAYSTRKTLAVRHYGWASVLGWA